MRNRSSIMVSMNRLPIEKRAQILGLMVEGMSIRAISRVTGASKNTIVKLLGDVGTASASSLMRFGASSG
jgi:DNA-directed RNA polymerase specialized sigma24 family protein